MGYGGAISAGSNFVAGQLQGWASLLDKWAMEDAYKAELARQARYQKQAASVLKGQLPFVGAEGARTQLKDAYGGRLDLYGKTDATPLGFSMPNQDPGVTAPARQRLSEEKRAGLMKYGDWLFNQKMSNLVTGRSLDQITNFAAGTSRVFPYSMYDAQHKYDWLAEIGASIGAAGAGAAGVKSAFGGPPPSGSGGPGYGYGSPGTYNMYGPPGYYDSQRQPIIDPMTGMPVQEQFVIG